MSLGVAEGEYDPGPEWEPWELIPSDVGERLDQIRRIIGTIWGSGPITQAMWQDRNRRDAVEILENLERDVRNSGQKF